MTSNELANFVWPEYKTDKERIKMLSKKYKNVGIAEAFAQEYNHPLPQLINPDKIDLTPFEPRIGDVFEVSILSIEKNRVVFDTLNMKNELVSKVNLYKYDFFKKFVPSHPVKVMVTATDKRKITVDPISPLFDNWLCEYVGGRDVQKCIAAPKTVRVKNLKLTKGGFMGEVSVNSIVDFVHEDYTIPVFIPGSQIVLNIAENFDDFIGKEVDAFVVNYIKNPITSEISLICSSKEYYKFLGECNMIEIFNAWCEENEDWKNVSETAFDGKVTGIINSSKKCGVFVEIPELNITGLVNVKPDELVNYKPYSNIKVKIKGFDEETYYNQTMKQIQHVEPYIINNGVLEKCNLKPILDFA